jgi:hypothetical protein
VAFAASLGAIFLNDPRPWYRDAVVKGSLWVAASLVLVGLGAELLGRFFRGPVMQLYLLMLVITAAVVPNLYLNAAAFFGRETADFQTWHLLPLFAVMYQVEAVMWVAIFAGLGCLVYLALRRLRKGSPNNALEQTRDG